MITPTGKINQTTSGTTDTFAYDYDDESYVCSLVGPASAIAYDLIFNNYHPFMRNIFDSFGEQVVEPERPEDEQPHEQFKNVFSIWARAPPLIFFFFLH